MTYEVVCGQCQGRLRVEPHAGAVACPFCGSTLIVPDDEATLADTPALEVGETHAATAGERSVFDSSIVRTAEQVPVPSSVKLPDFTRWGSGSSVGLSSAESVESFEDERSELEPSAAATSEPARRPSESPAPKLRRGIESKPRPSEGVSQRTFLAVVIYASVLTAVTLGLIFYILTAPQRELESLPDVVPPRDAEGNISRVLAPADAELPPGHVLRIGESRRFGDLRVTPLRVSREPLSFVHYRSDEQREPAGEVVKLWLKLENVSSDGKSFAPIDGHLLFYRTPDSEKAAARSNNFLAAKAGRNEGDLVPIYDHPPGSDWDLKDQELGKVLAPGESVVTYVPSDTGISDLSGPLSWRVHLRKGIADNGWGVTTLIEVAFDAAAIEQS